MKGPSRLNAAAIEVLGLPRFKYRGLDPKSYFLVVTDRTLGHLPVTLTQNNTKKKPSSTVTDEMVARQILGAGEEDN